jgi:hypothetical protein
MGTGDAILLVQKTCKTLDPLKVFVVDAAVVLVVFEALRVRVRILRALGPVVCDVCGRVLVGRATGAGKRGDEAYVAPDMVEFLDSPHLPLPMIMSLLISSASRGDCVAHAFSR